MRRIILLLSAMALALLLVSGVALAQPQGAPRQVLDVYCKVNESTLGSESSSRSTALSAQSFEAKHTGRLTSAKVRVSLFGDEPTAIVMEIRTVNSSGTPTEMVKARTTIPAPDVPNSMGVVTGNFRPGAPVEAGQQYAIVLYPPAGGRSVGEAATQIFAQACPLVPMRLTLEYFSPPPQIMTNTSQRSSRLAPLEPLPGRGRPRTAQFATRRPGLGDYPTPVASPSSSRLPLCWRWLAAGRL